MLQKAPWLLLPLGYMGCWLLSDTQFNFYAEAV